MAASILTYRHFTGEYNIPQLSQITVQEAVQQFISRYEPIALREVFGMYFAYFVEAVIMAQAAGVPPQGRWDVLLNGGTYYLSGTAFKFPGIANPDSLSFLAAYVFYWWSRNETSFTSGVGEVKPTSANARSISPVTKQVRAWNLFVGLATAAREFVQNATDENGLPMFPEMRTSRPALLTPISVFGI